MQGRFAYFVRRRSISKVTEGALHTCCLMYLLRTVSLLAHALLYLERREKYITSQIDSIGGNDQEMAQGIGGLLRDAQLANELIHVFDSLKGKCSVIVLRFSDSFAGNIDSRKISQPFCGWCG